MDASKFKKFADLSFAGRHEISELHVLLCEPPRPVAARVKQGYKLLPPSLWSVAEFVARAGQTIEAEEVAAGNVFQCLVEMLTQIVDHSSILSQTSDLRGEGILMLLLTKGQERSVKRLAITDGVADVAEKSETCGSCKEQDQLESLD